MPFTTPQLLVPSVPIIPLIRSGSREQSVLQEPFVALICQCGECKQKALTITKTFLNSAYFLICLLSFIYLIFWPHFRLRGLLFQSYISRKCSPCENTSGRSLEDSHRASVLTTLNYRRCFLQWNFRHAPPPACSTQTVFSGNSPAVL